MPFVRRYRNAGTSSAIDWQSRGGECRGRACNVERRAASPRKWLVWCALIWGVLAGVAHAAVLHVTNGILTGASDVLVDGIFYEVSFVDGTCITVYPSPYGAPYCAVPFASKPEHAFHAARALMSQVFLDGPAGPFDTSPELTRGCSDPDVCNVFIPDDLYCEEGICGVAGLNSVNARDVIDNPEVDGWGYVYSIVDMTASPSITYATWTPTGIPAPATHALLVLAAASLWLATSPHRRPEVESRFAS